MIALHVDYLFTGQEGNTGQLTVQAYMLSNSQAIIWGTSIATVKKIIVQ